MLTEILDKLASLARFPPSGTPPHRPHLTARAFLHGRSYVIAYAPEGKPLWIIAVMHGSRSPRVMAAILRGRED